MHLLLIDNFDSFTWNLAQLFMTLDCRVTVRRNTTPLAELTAIAPDALLISPGPGTPRDSGVSMKAMRHWMHDIPVLGVCLGMQVINECFGGRTVHAAEPVHGKAQPLRHDGSGIFEGLPSPFRAARYHSLAIERHSEELIEQAWSQDGTIMAVRHASLPLHGVQFHPESFLTEHGAVMARKFLSIIKGVGYPETGRAARLRPLRGTSAWQDGSALQEQALQEQTLQEQALQEQALQEQTLQEQTLQIPDPQKPDDLNIGKLLSGLRWSAAAMDLPAMSAMEFAEEAHQRARGAPHVILLSGEEHDCSRRSVAFLRPAAVLRVNNGRAALAIADDILHENSDPFALLRQAQEGLMSSYAEAHAQDSTQDADAPSTPSPMIGGYVAYEAARAIEKLPGTTHDELALPDLFFLWPTEMLVRSHDDGSVTRLRLTWRHDGMPLPEINEAEDGCTDIDPGVTDVTDEESHEVEMCKAASEKMDAPDTVAESPLRRSFSRAAYEEAVRRVRRHIRDGDVYQVNLSQRFVYPLREHPFRMWIRLYEINPAPFYAYIDAGDHKVLSTSMERLFRIEDRKIETRPIKGTRPRGATQEEDARLARELSSSAKDDAELSMIVDLARNDIGHVCRAGSVRVAEHRRIERYANVMHLVSVVRGALRPDANIAGVFRALFPGGSITGCPKIRAMEIIDDLEPVTRHAYTGCVGLLAADGTADFSIAIRTAIVKDGDCHLSVGGGIVHDSDPAEEYAETLAKGATFFRLAGIAPHISDSHDMED